jgi:hypothetical protein
MFSLEGGIRQGHPRYVIFITGGDTDLASKDLVEAAEPLRDLNVNILAVGVNANVSIAFLSKLASHLKYTYTTTSADDLAEHRLAIEQEMCHGELQAFYHVYTQIIFHHFLPFSMIRWLQIALIPFH